MMGFCRLFEGSGVKRVHLLACCVVFLGLAVAGWCAGMFEHFNGVATASQASNPKSVEPLKMAWVPVLVNQAEPISRGSNNASHVVTPESEDIPVIEMGEVYEGKSAKARFVLKSPNKKKPVRFGRVLGGCDCVETVLSTRQPADDESVYLDVTLHTGNLSGTKRYRIHAEVLEPDPVLLAADIVATIIPKPAPLLVQPPAFSWPNPAVGAKAEVELSNLSGTPLRVTGLTVEGDGIALAGSAPMVLSPGSSRKIVVTRTAPSGGGKVLIQTDHPGHERLEVGVPK